MQAKLASVIGTLTTSRTYIGTGNCSSYGFSYKGRNTVIVKKANCDLFHSPGVSKEIAVTSFADYTVYRRNKIVEGT